jgi:hypothetical protein
MHVFGGCIARPEQSSKAMSIKGFMTVTLRSTSSMVCGTIKRTLQRRIRSF